MRQVFRFFPVIADQWRVWGARRIVLGFGPLLSAIGNPLNHKGAYMYRVDRFVLFFLGLIAAVVATTGCGGTPTLQTEYVEGVVTVDGQPVAEATVTFVPVTEGQGASATGMTDAQGVYKLTAAVTGEVAAKAEAGTLPGEYYVGVMKNVVDTPLSQEEAEQQGIEYEPPPPGTLQEPKITFVVPQKYNNPRKSGIQVTVQQGQNNIPIELTSE